MVAIGKPKPKKGQFYHQSGLGQKGWKLNPIDYEARRNQFQDEAFHNTLAVHDPLWRYIVNHYSKEIYNHENIASVTVLGYDSLPIAIELSQWGYPVIFIADNLEEYEKAKKDCEIQAGKLKDLLYFDYRRNIPQGTAICFLGILDDPMPFSRLFTYIDLLLRRNREIICALYESRDWVELLVELLRDKYKVQIMRYPNQPLVLLSIKQVE